MELILEFGYSSSPNYKKAVQIAENHHSYESEGSGKSIVHRIKYPLEDFYKHRNLYEIASGWKSFRIIYNSNEILWYELDRIVQCWRMREHSSSAHCYETDLFTPNVSFGCKQLGKTMHSWYKKGRMDELNHWMVDKDAIKEFLEREISESGVEACPMFNEQMALRCVDYLPDVIDPKHDVADPEVPGEWSYEYVYPGGRKVAIGIAWEWKDVEKETEIDDSKVVNIFKNRDI